MANIRIEMKTAFSGGGFAVTRKGGHKDEYWGSVCGTSFHKEIDLPSNVRTIDAVFSKKKAAGCFTIDTPSSDSRYGTSIIKGVTAEPMYGARATLAKLYRKGYKYFWIEY
jgi:hypothetical protein